MRFENFNQNSYYELLSTNRKEDIFLDTEDFVRFIFLILYLQSPLRIYNTFWYTNRFLKKNSFSANDNKMREILKRRSVKLIAFALAPHGFRLVIKNIKEGIASVYMHRIKTAYSKYFNKKYKRKGHVFDGPFKSKKIKNQNELVEVSRQIHKNPENTIDWQDNYEKYPWSSYQDYIVLNRWGDFLASDTILDKFKNKEEYRKFVLSKEV